MSVNFTGIWHANLSKSRFLGPPPIAIAVKIEHSDPELQEKILVTKVDGSEERVVFECWTNGKEGKSLLNGSAVRGNARWEGDELVIESWMQFGTRQMHFCDCWSLSPDGQILSTNTARTIWLDNSASSLGRDRTISELHITQFFRNLLDAAVVPGAFGTYRSLRLIKFFHKRKKRLHKFGGVRSNDSIRYFYR